MNENKWKSIWEKRTADFHILQGDDVKSIIKEFLFKRIFC